MLSKIIVLIKNSFIRDQIDKIDSYEYIEHIGYTDTEEIYCKSLWQTGNFLYDYFLDIGKRNDKNLINCDLRY